jgi:hypothetical protein
MSQFEFFLAFYSLMLGLGVAQLLGGFGNLLRETPTPRLGLIMPLLGLQLLLELLSNFVYAWHKFDSIPITLPGLVLPTLIGVAYYLAATIITPANFGELQTLDDYFDRRQRWIVGLMLAANILVEAIALQHPERTIGAGGDGNYVRLALTLAWLFGSYLILLLSRRRWLQVLSVLSLMSFYLYIFVFLQLIEQVE